MTSCQRVLFLFATLSLSWIQSICFLHLQFLFRRLELPRDLGMIFNRPGAARQLLHHCIPSTSC